MNNTLRALQDYGQSPWLDCIQRSLVAGGELKRLIEEDGGKGVASNPSIFAKAITEGREDDGKASIGEGDRHGVQVSG